MFVLNLSVQINIYIFTANCLCNICDSYLQQIVYVTSVIVFMLTDAFQKAKHRMVAARENLKTDFIKTLTALALHGDTDA